MIEYFDHQDHSVGGLVKALDEGSGRKIGGYLVSYGSPEQRDLDGEYFTKDTYFYEVQKLPLVYHHGGNAALKGPSAHLGSLEISYKEAGVWAEGEVRKADQYGDQILNLVKAGKLRFSSGAAPHLSFKENGHIKAWLMAEGSVAPAVKDFRNSVVPLKALLDEEVDSVISRQTLRDLGGFLKAGRSLSSANRETLEKLYAELLANAEKLREFLAANTSGEDQSPYDLDFETLTALAMARATT